MPLPVDALLVLAHAAEVLHGQVPAHRCAEAAKSPSSHAKERARGAVYNVARAQSSPTPSSTSGYKSRHAALSARARQEADLDLETRSNSPASSAHDNDVDRTVSTYLGSSSSGGVDDNYDQDIEIARAIGSESRMPHSTHSFSGNHMHTLASNTSSSSFPSDDDQQSQQSQSEMLPQRHIQRQSRKQNQPLTSYHLRLPFTSAESSTHTTAVVTETTGPFMTYQQYSHPLVNSSTIDTHSDGGGRDFLTMRSTHHRHQQQPRRASMPAIDNLTRSNTSDLSREGSSTRSYSDSCIKQTGNEGVKYLYQSYGRMETHTHYPYESTDRLDHSNQCQNLSGQDNNYTASGGEEIGYEFRYDINRTNNDKTVHNQYISNKPLQNKDSLRRLRKNTTIRERKRHNGDIIMNKADSADFNIDNEEHRNDEDDDEDEEDDDDDEEDDDDDDDDYHDVKYSASQARSLSLPSRNKSHINKNKSRFRRHTASFSRRNNKSNTSLGNVQAQSLSQNTQYIWPKQNTMDPEEGLNTSTSNLTEGIQDTGPMMMLVLQNGTGSNTVVHPHLLPNNKNNDPTSNSDHCTSGMLMLDNSLTMPVGTYPCRMCNEIFTNIWSLQCHQKEHGHVCDTCKKSFSRAYNLKAHQKVHTQEKPFLCQFCHRSFARKQDCLRHQRIHTKERPYVCDSCGLSFSRSDGLTRHKCGNFNYDPEDYDESSEIERIEDDISEDYEGLENYGITENLHSVEA